MPAPPNSTHIDEVKIIQSRIKVCEAINEKDLNKIIGILDKQPKEFLNKCLNDPIRDTRLLVLAAKEGLDNIVKYLVSKGADPNLTGSITIDDETINEATPLWTAACFGHLKTVKLLVEHDSLIDKGTATQSTPVRAACYEGHLEIDMKRLIGNKNASECLIQNGKYWSFKIVCDLETVVELNVNGEKKCIKPEEVSSLVLIKLKKAAEVVARQPITDIVLTVPAYFDEHQKKATIKAAKLAGLNVLELISEPSAAAYAYEYNKRDASNLNLLIFDLGSGKLDVVILKVKNGNFDVVTIGGDTQLGGRDFDHLLMDYFVDILVEKYNKDIREKDEKSLQAQQKLLQECIDLKHMLTVAEDSNLYLGGIFPDINENIEMSRSTFNQICFNLFDRIETVISETLKEADMTPKDINEIVLVGGSSRIPKIEELLLKIFPIKELNKSLNLDEAIAYGATLRATQLINNSIPNIQLTEANASRLRELNSQLEHLVIEPTTPPNSTHIDEDKLIQSRFKVCEAINEKDLNKIIAILDKQPKEFLKKCLNDPLQDPRLLFRDTRLLVLAAKEGLDNIVKYLVSKGADPNLTGSIIIGDETIYEATPLWTAAYFGHLNTVKLLVEHGSLIDKGTDTKCTPVRAACYEGHLEIGRTPLMAAAHNNIIEVVRCLLEKDANPNIKDNHGNTALHYATGNNDNNAIALDDNNAIVKLLLEYGADNVLGL
uniref:Uncharacterized protein n=1 Tax=Acrobeloides nanus TaxID=290746 RepID=A0A914CMB6_9BILA